LLRDLVAACRDAMIAAIQLLKFGFGEKWLRIILQNLCWPSGIVDAGECMLHGDAMVPALFAFRFMFQRLCKLGSDSRMFELRF
jgi:hypothetical protein